jgi:hypothetical protein
MVNSLTAFRVSRKWSHHDDIVSIDPISGTVPSPQNERNIQGHRDEIDDCQRNREKLLSGVDASSIDEYRALVERREETDEELGPAKRSLEDALGTPGDGGDDLEYWAAQLDGLVEDLDLGEIDADAFDEDRKAVLHERVADLETQVDELQAALQEHSLALESFDDRASDLVARLSPTNPFASKRDRPMASGSSQTTSRPSPTTSIVTPRSPDGRSRSSMHSIARRRPRSPTCSRRAAGPKRCSPRSPTTATSASTTTPPNAASWSSAMTGPGTGPVI